MLCKGLVFGKCLSTESCRKFSATLVFTNLLNWGGGVKPDNDSLPLSLCRRWDRGCSGGVAGGISNE